MNVLRHVAIQDLESGGVERISPVDSRDFVVLRSTEFGVLCPQIGLDLLGRGKKSQDGYVASGDRRPAILLVVPKSKRVAPQEAASQVAAPAATAPFLKNPRRFVLRVKAFPSVFICFPFFQLVSKWIQQMCQARSASTSNKRLDFVKP